MINMELCSINNLTCLSDYETYNKATLNGCGPCGLLGKLISNSIYGLDISEACNIHDHMYVVLPKSEQSKVMADEIFRTNMLVLINNGTIILRWLRARKAAQYYFAVKYLGARCFYGGTITKWSI